MSKRKHPLSNCEECPMQGMEHKYVPSHGPEKADKVFIGEAPGFKETVSGQPFSGPSGRLLNAVLDNYGIERDSIFVTNVVSCRPRNNEPPSKRAIQCCSKRLQAEVSSREPSRIITLGATAASAVFGKPVAITSFRAGPPKQSTLYPNIDIIPTFHPAACLRNNAAFPSLVTDIGKAAGVVTTQKWEAPQYVAYDDEVRAGFVLNELLRGYDEFVIDIETAYEKDASFERPNHYPLLCVGIGYAPNKVVVIGRNALKTATVKAKLRELVERKRIIAHNGKFDLIGLAGIAPNGRIYFDTMLASYALDERGGVHKLKYLSAERLGCPDYESEIKAWNRRKGESWATFPADDLHRYNAYDVANTWALYKIYDQELGDLRNLNNFLTDASNFLMEVELGGMKVDTVLLFQLEQEYQKKLLVHEEGMYEWVDNPRSTKQVTEALKDFGIETESTDAAHINELLDNHLPKDSEPAEFCRRLLAYRKEQKIYGTYIKGTKERLFDGRVHTTFLLHGTTTGRLSSRNPNLQNVPRGSTIKSLFVPEKGNVLIQADYNQLEFRVVCCLAKEEAVAEIFRDPSRDVFGEFSAMLFGPNWTKDHRQIMKRVVHGTNYGMEAKTMAAQINSDAKQFGVDLFVTPEEASKFQRFYRGLVPNIIAWQEATIEELFHSNDDLTTSFGRHHRVGLITEENKYSVIHEGLAFRPQSLASDICLSAAMGLHTNLKKEAPSAHIRLLVHDSIIVEAPAKNSIFVSDMMQHYMTETAAEWDDFVPFAIELKSSSESWGKL